MILEHVGFIYRTKHVVFTIYPFTIYYLLSADAMISPQTP